MPNTETNKSYPIQSHQPAVIVIRQWLFSFAHFYGGTTCKTTYLKTCRTCWMQSFWLRLCAFPNPVPTHWWASRTFRLCRSAGESSWQNRISSNGCSPTLIMVGGDIYVDISLSFVKSKYRPWYQISYHTHFPTVRYLLGSAFPKPCCSRRKRRFFYCCQTWQFHFFLLEVMHYREKI